MKHYYTYINGKQIGPITIEELKLLDIEKSTLVWYEGLSDWIEAEKIEELSDYFDMPLPPPIVDTTKPPPIKNKTNSRKLQDWFVKQSSLTKYGMIGGTLLFVIILWTSFKTVNNSSNRKISEGDYVLIDTAKASKIEEENRLKEIEIEEKANKKLLEVKQAEEKQKNKEELKQLQSEKTRLEIELYNAGERMEAAEYDIEAATQELERVRVWQLGRLRSERERQENRVLEKIAGLQREYYTAEVEEREFRQRLNKVNQRINQLVLKIQNNITYSN